MTIDWWTLGLQTVNVLVLIWLLGRFFWRPVAAMIEERRAAAASLLADAEAKRKEAADALVEIEKTKAGFGQEHDAIVAAAHTEAERVAAAQLAAATQEAASLEAAAHSRIAKTEAEGRAAWRQLSARLAVTIAERLAARLDGTAIRAAFLDWLVAEIARLPATERQAAAANGSLLEAVSALPLDPVEQAHCQERLATALGGSAPIIFRSDPALIAGLELHGPHLAVSNSWRADLDRILTEIAHDDRV